MHGCAVFQRIDHIGHHSACGGQLACALAVEHHIAQHIALYQHCVEHIVHTGQLIAEGHQHGLNGSRDRAIFIFARPYDQLDGAVQLFSCLHILHRDIADAAGGNVLGVHMTPKAKAA